MVKCLAMVMFGSVVLAQTRVDPDARVVQDFEQRVHDYVEVRTKLAAGLPVVKPTNDPQAILNRQSKLGDRIRSARRSARQGDIFTPAISKEFHRLLALAELGRNDSDIQKSLQRSEPVRLTLHVNDAYPADVPLQSMPPTILSNLPVLKPGLEYRIVGRALVLRDASANIVVDIMPNALP